MLTRLIRRRRKSTANAQLATPAIVYAGEAYEAWVSCMEQLADARLAVELTFIDGSTRDATLRGAGYYGPHSLAGVTVAFWDGDQEPPADALETVVYSTDFTRIYVY